jgi:hypothetical protein
MGIGPKATPDQVEQMVETIRNAERITHFEASIDPVTPKDESKVDYPTAEEMFAIFKDASQDPMLRTIAFFCASHKKINAGLTKQAFMALGKFGNVDFYFIVRNPNYEGEGWRYKLTRLLRKWNLIEEFI